MEPTFDGIQIFGSRCRQRGPFSRARNQRSILPGVSGYRTYALGTESVIWHVRGLLVASSAVNLENLLFTGANYVDSALYDFETTAGTLFPNCQLNEFAPDSDVVRCKLANTGADGWCCYVRGVVEWVAPP